MGACAGVRVCEHSARVQSMTSCLVHTAMLRGTSRDTPRVGKMQKTNNAFIGHVSVVMFSSNIPTQRGEVLLHIPHTALAHVNVMTHTRVFCGPERVLGVLK